MGGQQSRGGEGGESEQDKKDKKAKKYEAPPPTRVGKKKKKKAGPPQSARVPNINPTAKCKLRLLKLERVKDYLLLEEEFVLRQEQVKPQEESAQKERTKVEDIRGSPMNVASLEEMIDDNHAIVASNVGPEYYVNIMSFVDKDQLEPGCSLLTHYRVNSIVGLLADEADPMVSVMKVDKAPTESYADIGGLEQQIMEMKEAVEVRAAAGPAPTAGTPPTLLPWARIVPGEEGCALSTWWRLRPPAYPPCPPPPLSLSFFFFFFFFPTALSLSLSLSHHAPCLARPP